jgi:AAA+ ATPase superfamily predicted ATPase
MRKKYLELTKEDYIKALKHGISRVVFEKVNGDIREMFATLDESLIPKTEKELAEEKLDLPKRKSNDNVVSVFDMQAQSWRAFRILNVIGFNKLHTNKT